MKDWLKWLCNSTAVHLNFASSQRGKQEAKHVRRRAPQASVALLEYYRLPLGVEPNIFCLPAELGQKGQLPTRTVRNHQAREVEAMAHSCRQNSENLPICAKSRLLHP